jgi:hypothetical protein
MLETFATGFACGCIVAPLLLAIRNSIRQKRRRMSHKIYLRLEQ